MVQPVVHRFASTKSFDGARANFPLLQEVPSEMWTRERVEVTERAIEENSQLRDANLLEPGYKSVPDATMELLAPARQRLGMDLPVDPGVIDDDIPF